MNTTPKTVKKAAKQSVQTKVPFHQHHYFRTIVASFFGFVALNLIIISILVYWANKTFTNTDNYVKAVSPLVTEPAVQNFIADKVALLLLDSKDASPQDLGTQILGAQAVVGKSNDQIKAELKPVIKESVRSIVSSNEFASLWTTTNRNAHMQLVNSLKNNYDNVTLDLHPIVVGVVDQLSRTKLAPIKDKLKIESETGKVTFNKNDWLSQLPLVQEEYNNITKLLPVLLVLTTVFTALSIIISVNHLKTLRRITFFTGLSTGLWAIALNIPSFVKLKGNDDTSRQLAKAIVSTVFHSLETSLIVISVTCLTIAFCTKIYSVLKSHRA